MATTRPEKDQATQPVQTEQYQPDGRQEAPTNPDALYGGNADDNSGSGGNARPTTHGNTPDGDASDQADAQKDSPISGPGASGGTGASGTSIGQVTL